MRLPPSNIQILLPVWGERYTRDFLDLCLPSLLAPGNIPALSMLAPCKLVLLTSVRDAAVLKRNPLWTLLLRYCEVRIETIDSLLSESSSAVLTLAYALAIRDTGRQALDTCFIPLVADYVLSDGALSSVVARIFAGASGVLAGNFQIESEKAFHRLESNKNDAGLLAISPRALVDISLGALHQSTLSQIVDAGSRYNPQTNRLFFRVDERCMVGRFFLMHMIAIRPETLDFIIAASSDYSLIPELCPSGNVVRMTDSDDYFVVECLPRAANLPTLSEERLSPRSIANGVAHWATGIHRGNARHALVFHSGPPSPRLAETIACSKSFVSQVEALITTPPMPFRHHPLWLRSLDHHAASARMEQSPARLAVITGDPSIANGFGRASRLRDLLLGRAPYFRPWHPRWMDVRALKQSLATVSGNGRVAIAADLPIRIRLWLERAAVAAGAISVTHIPTADIPAQADAGSEATFDCCLFLSSDLSSAELPKILSCLMPVVKPGGAIVIGIGRIFSDTVCTLPSIVPPPDLVFSEGRVAIQKTDGVPGDSQRIGVQRAMMRFAREFSDGSSITSIFSLAAAGVLAMVSLGFNRSLVVQKPVSGPHFTSLFFTFRCPVVETTGGVRIHQRGQSEVAGRSKGETCPSSLQFLLNFVSRRRERSNGLLRAGILPDAAGFPMRGR